jgi:hypothetical protein
VATWYADSTVNSGGSGTEGSPWSFETAFSGASGSIQPGDRVHLRGTRSKSTSGFTISVSGSGTTTQWANLLDNDVDPPNAIVFEAWPGYSWGLRYAGWSTHSPLDVAGSWVIVQGGANWGEWFDLACAPTGGQRQTGEESGRGAYKQNGSYQVLRRAVIHDANQGIETTGAGPVGFLAEDCIIGNIGTDEALREDFRRCVFLGPHPTGGGVLVHAFSSGGGNLYGIRFHDCVVAYESGGVVFGSGDDLTDFEWVNNWTLLPNFQMIYDTGFTGNTMTVTDNAFIATSASTASHAVRMDGVMDLTFRRNRIRSNARILRTGIGGQPTSGSDIDDNDYYASDTQAYDAGGTTGTIAFWRTTLGGTKESTSTHSTTAIPDDLEVIPSTDGNSALVRILNFSASATRSILDADLAGFLVNGDGYELYDVQEALDPTTVSAWASGTYNGTSISVDMSLATPAPLVDATLYADAAPLPTTFRVFQLVRTSETTGTTVTPALVTASTTVPAPTVDAQSSGGGTIAQVGTVLTGDNVLASSVYATFDGLPEAGQLLVVDVNLGTDRTVTVQNGFTYYAVHTQTNSRRQYRFYKIATGTETQAILVATLSSASTSRWHTRRFSGVDQTTPVRFESDAGGNVQDNTTAGTSVNFTTSSAAQSGDLVVAFHTINTGTPVTGYSATGWGDLTGTSNTMFTSWDLADAASTQTYVASWTGSVTNTVSVTAFAAASTTTQTASAGVVVPTVTVPAPTAVPEGSPSAELVTATVSVLAPSIVTSSAGGRDPYDWPFAITSPWNTPAGDGATYTAVGSAITNSLRAGGANINALNWSHPFYQGTVANSLYDVRLRPAGQTGDLSTSTALWNASTPVAFSPIRCPSTAQPANNPNPLGPGTDANFDRHMHVLQPDGTLREMYAVRIDHVNRRIFVNHSASFSITGSGTNYPTPYASTRATGVSAVGGLIRYEEMTDLSFPHALAIALSATSLATGPVWPASSDDGNPNYSGTVKNGTLAVIPDTVDLTVQGLSPIGLALGRAMQRYGCYVVDRSSGFTLYAEPSCETHPLMVAMRAAAATLQDQLVAVTNNYNGTTGTIGGPGTRLAALAPDFTSGDPSPSTVTMLVEVPEPVVFLGNPAPAVVTASAAVPAPSVVVDSDTSTTVEVPVVTATVTVPTPTIQAFEPPTPGLVTLTIDVLAPAGLGESLPFADLVLLTIDVLLNDPGIDQPTTAIVPDLIVNVTIPEGSVPPSIAALTVLLPILIRQAFVVDDAEKQGVGLVTFGRVRLRWEVGRPRLRWEFGRARPRRH